jgi:hypothetical protein
VCYGLPSTGTNSAMPLLVIRTRRTSMDVSSTFAELDHLIPTALPAWSTRRNSLSVADDDASESLTERVGGH